MNKIKQQMLASDLPLWRKRGLFAVVLLLGLFPFFISYTAVKPDLAAGFWQLRHFLGVAAIQAIAQIAIAWYLLKTPVPNYVILSFVLMVMFFQLTFGLTVILLSSA